MAAPPAHDRPGRPGRLRRIAAQASHAIHRLASFIGSVCAVATVSALLAGPAQGYDVPVVYEVVSGQEMCIAGILVTPGQMLWEDPIGSATFETPEALYYYLGYFTLYDDDDGNWFGVSVMRSTSTSIAFPLTVEIYNRIYSISGYVDAPQGTPWSQKPYTEWLAALTAAMPKDPGGEGPPPTDEDDMTDAQMAQVFANLSTQTAKVVASNTSLSDLLSSGIYAVTGLIAACVVAVTWKG